MGGLAFFLGCILWVVGLELLSRNSRFRNLIVFEILSLIREIECTKAWGMSKARV